MRASIIILRYGWARESASEAAHGRVDEPLAPKATETSYPKPFAAGLSRTGRPVWAAAAKSPISFPFRNTPP